jgi:peptidoglycan hydrolase-like protein with peptidoglycan-binding domain
MPETLRKGSTGSGVRDAQGKLKTVQYYTGLLDGTFGAKMETSVKNFQTAKNFSTVDGIIGEQTWTVLNNAVGA